MSARRWSVGGLMRDDRQLEVSEGAAPLTRRRRVFATYVRGAIELLRQMRASDAGAGYF